MRRKKGWKYYSNGKEKKGENIILNAKEKNYFKYEGKKKGRKYYLNGRKKKAKILF